MKVKICGLKTPSDIDFCIKANADFIGLVFFNKSPRNLTLPEAYKLSHYYADNYANSDLKKVALCVNPSDSQLKQIISSSRADYLQLHGTESPARVEEIRQKHGLPTIKAIRVRNKQDIKTSQEYENYTDWLLFDAASSAHLPPGGNGKSFNWSLLSDFDSDVPWMLAGGLRPDNVDIAISETKPYAVDVSSGVEIKIGVKDPLLISAFVQSAKIS